jgi:hypothetical protein
LARFFSFLARFFSFFAFFRRFFSSLLSFFSSAGSSGKIPGSVEVGMKFEAVFWADLCATRNKPRKIKAMPPLCPPSHQRTSPWGRGLSPQLLQQQLLGIQTTLGLLLNLFATLPVAFLLAQFSHLWRLVVFTVVHTERALHELGGGGG